MYNRTLRLVRVVLGMASLIVCFADKHCGGGRSAKAAPSPNIPATRGAIDVLCDGLVPLTKQSGGRIFGETSGAGTSWREYADAKELQSVLGESEILQKARVWRRKDGVTAVQMVEDPMSGDWSQAVDYCFRSDGSLARLESKLVTFDTADEINEGVERLRVRYFAPNGRELSHREDVKNSKSRLPAKRVFADKTETAYRTVRDLPFAALLTK